MGNDDKIHNPVEQYMQFIMDQDKPDKSPETTTEPTRHLEVKKRNNKDSSDAIGSQTEAIKVGEAIKQSVNFNINSAQDSPEQTQQTNETRVFDVGRHPVGLIAICVAVIISYAIVFSAVGFLLPGLVDTFGVKPSSVGLLMLVVFIVGVIYMIFIGRGYLLNRLILTDFNIVHILQQGLFRKKIFELSLTDIEDIYIEKSGLLPILFNYGTITIKTAYSRNDLIFRYVPGPDVCAKAVEDTKLTYLAGYNRTVNP